MPSLRLEVLDQRRGLARQLGRRLVGDRGDAEHLLRMRQRGGGEQQCRPSSARRVRERSGMNMVGLLKVGWTGAGPITPQCAAIALLQCRLAMDRDTPSEFVQLHQRSPRRSVATNWLRPCWRPEPSVAPKFLYDALGSRLFDAITELDEYYPTRTEAAIFAAHARRDRALGRHRADAGRPGRRQLREGRAPVRCAASGTLRGGGHLGRLPAPRAAPTCSAATRRCAMVGVGLDFSQRLALPPTRSAPRRG